VREYTRPFGVDVNTRRTERTRDIIERLSNDGWVLKRKGPGDHRQFVHPDKPGKVTIDMGAKELPIGTLRSVYRQAGWTW
jgi:predicted RNA binding protein YcfA (HicA-like mRNA interferase family)